MILDLCARGGYRWMFNYLRDKRIRITFRIGYGPFHTQQTQKRGLRGSLKSDIETSKGRNGTPVLATGNENAKNERKGECNTTVSSGIKGQERRRKLQEQDNKHIAELKNVAKSSIKSATKKAAFKLYAKEVSRKDGTKGRQSVILDFYQFSTIFPRLNPKDKCGSHCQLTAAFGDILLEARTYHKASLAGVIEKPEQHLALASAFEPKNAIAQIISHVQGVHNRSRILGPEVIKPQNICISLPREGSGLSISMPECKMRKGLDLDPTSLLVTRDYSNTLFEREIYKLLLKEVTPSRLARAGDIFTLTYLVLYILTKGKIGGYDGVNVDKGTLTGTLRLLSWEARGFVDSLFDTSISQRPDLATCFNHPFFWDSARRVDFLTDTSDALKHIRSEDKWDRVFESLERGSQEIIGDGWKSDLKDVTMSIDSGPHDETILGLIRMIRNTRNHFHDLPEKVKEEIGSVPDGFLSYFTDRYPRIFMHVYEAVKGTDLRNHPPLKYYF